MLVCLSDVKHLLPIKQIYFNQKNKENLAKKNNISGLAKIMLNLSNILIEEYIVDKPK